MRVTSVGWTGSEDACLSGFLQEMQRRDMPVQDWYCNQYAYKLPPDGAELLHGTERAVMAKFMIPGLSNNDLHVGVSEAFADADFGNRLRCRRVTDGAAYLPPGHDPPEIPTTLFVEERLWQNQQGWPQCPEPDCR